MPTIAILGTLDTKGREHAYVADQIRGLGYDTLLIDVSTDGNPTVEPNITRDMVRQLAVASSDQSDLSRRERNEASDDRSHRERGIAIAEMVRMVPNAMQKLLREGRIQGIVSLGGSGGTSIATAAMRALPLGFPKVMVSTVAGKDVSQYVGVCDIIMMPSIVDVSGLNRISKEVFARAASVVVAIAEANRRLDSVQRTAMREPTRASRLEQSEHAWREKPLIVASMFGNTTRCIEHARNLLEKRGYEVLVFHATGTGGRTMEAIIESGAIAGVLDITTTEWADELVGGIMGAGPSRLESAARHAIPAIVAPGCLDMVNFGGPSTVPEKFRDRIFYQHNPEVTLMRTSPEECRQLGSIIASKLNLSRGPVELVYPLRALSVISAAGKPFHDPMADESLLQSLQATIRSDIHLALLDCEINDPQFAQYCVDRLLGMIENANR